MNGVNAIPAAWIEHDKNIKPYLWSHRVLSIGKTALTLGLLIWFVVSLRAFHLEDFLERKLEHPFLRWLAYFGIVMAVLEVCTLPMSVAHHWVERSYQLSKQTYRSWFWDKAKGWMLGAVLGGVFLSILHLCVVKLGDFWWVAAALLFIGVSILLAQMAPVLLIPIFFKLEPMDSGELKDRLLKMCERFGVEVKEV